jgi:hypothetical protein
MPRTAADEQAFVPDGGTLAFRVEGALDRDKVPDDVALGVRLNDAWWLIVLHREGAQLRRVGCSAHVLAAFDGDEIPSSTVLFKPNGVLEVSQLSRGRRIGTWTNRFRLDRRSGRLLHIGWHDSADDPLGEVDYAQDRDFETGRGSSSTLTHTTPMGPTTEQRTPIPTTQRPKPMDDL